jgi:hypothetical protein
MQFILGFIQEVQNILLLKPYAMARPDFIRSEQPFLSPPPHRIRMNIQDSGK